LGDIGCGVFVWGGQFEIGPFASSYIPTTTAQVTRSSDSLVATTTGWFVDSGEGSVAAQFAIPVLDASGGAPSLWALDDGTSTNIVRARQGTVITGTDANIVAGGVPQVDTQSATVALFVPHGSAFGWSLASSRYALDGAPVGDSVLVPTAMPVGINRLIVAGGSYGNKWLRRFMYFPIRLTDAQLQALST